MAKKHILIVPGDGIGQEVTAVGKKVLDKIAATGVPVEIERNGKKLKIISVGTPDKFATAKFYRDCIVGDPDKLDRID